MEARRGGRALAAVVAAAVVAVGGVLLAGPLQVIASVWPGVIVSTPTARATPRPFVPHDPSSRSRPENGTVSSVALIVVAVLLGVAVCALVVWLVRRWLARRVELVTAGPVESLDEEAGAPAGTKAVAPALRRGLERALELLEEPRDPADAVVQAWLGLEDAALLAGLPRAPSETPSEYVTRILQRHAADRGAADALRALYEDVRFGGVPADAESVALARTSLTRLLASWSRTAEPVAG